MTRAPSASAISRDPSVLPLSAMTISARDACRARYARALAMQAGSVFASLRHGIRIVSLMLSQLVMCPLVLSLRCPSDRRKESHDLRVRSLELRAPHLAARVVHITRRARPPLAPSTKTILGATDDVTCVRSERQMGTARAAA